MPEGLVAIAAVFYLAWASFSFLVMVAMPIAIVVGVLFFGFLCLWKWRKT